ncbi:MAG TPA: protein kinase [Thermoanaerobaculia bacterium]|nr:protein kinase [Thermoanaerobaculia bacterium]
MTLTAGARLGPYEILSPLGAGGMGEVYRARDAKLQRDVAIKVLPLAVAEDADRLARFRREAQVLAALNHPHIAAIYGLEESDGVEALVLELVEGETLAERIAAGPVPIEEALAIARQIADALEAAHEKGIVHRDLKPANVKITPQGKVKVLDFGLAKALTGDRSSPDVTHSPTLTAAATQAGVVIGTAAYMSPEQARGKAVDKRADIWAFGAVLYEMLSGRKSFEGETVSDTLAAVLRADVDWNALPRDTPASVRRVLRRCLDREVKTRFHDIADARIEMDETLQEPPPAAAAAPTPSRSKLWPLTAGALLVLAALGWWRALSSAPAPSLATRLSLVLPAGDRLPYEQEPIFALSRDGRQVAYVAEHAGTPALYLRTLDAAEARLIEGTSEATSPFFSPDGGWVGFFADGKLKKVAVGGGLPIALADVSTPRGGVWLDDDSIVFSPEYTSGLVRLPAGGGKPEVLTRPDVARGERTHRWPEALPGGADVLFTVGLASSPSDYDGAEIAVLNVASRKVRRVFDGGSMPRYVAPGRLAFLRGDSILVVPFDPGRAAVTGAAVPVVEKVSGDLAGGSAYYATARNGTLVSARGVAPQDRTLTLGNRKGEAIDVPLSPRHFLGPRFSPDAKRLAFSVGAGTGRDDDVWTYDIAGNILTRLTFGNTGLLAVWSPDGKRIAYGSIRGGAEGIYVKAADGGGQEEALQILKSSAEMPSAWSADGASLAFLRLSPTVGIWLVPLGEPSKVREIEPGALTARLSPDGRWIAYQTGIPGDIFVRPTDGSPGKWQITTDRGSWPVWVGNEIFFLREGGDILSVDVDTRPTFRAGAPRLVYPGKGRFDAGGLYSPFDVSSDGQSFVLMKTNARAEGAGRIDVVLNWPAELQRLAPVGGGK